MLFITNRHLSFDSTKLLMRRKQKLFYHRPLHELFSCFLQAGLVIDGLEEPNFDEDYVKENSLELGSFRQLTQFPKVLAFRLRVVGGK